MEMTKQNSQKKQGGMITMPFIFGKLHFYSSKHPQVQFLVVIKNIFHLFLVLQQMKYVRNWLWLDLAQTC